MVPARSIGALVIAHCFCVLLVRAEDDPYGKELSQEINQARRLGGMMIPLLIGISGRLAAIIPTAFLGTIGIFIFVALAKKAFVISLLAFLMVWMDKKNRHMKPKIMHIHHTHPSHSLPVSGTHASHSFSAPHSPSSFPVNPSSFDLDPNSPVYYSYDKGHSFSSQKKPLRKWPKVDNGAWSFTSPTDEMDMDSFLAQSAAVHPNSYLPQTTARLPSQYVPRLTTLDSYLPQTTRNIDSYLSQKRRMDGVPPIVYTPEGVFYPRLRSPNSTETPNTTVGITPQLQQFIEKSFAEQQEEDDPR